MWWRPKEASVWGHQICIQSLNIPFIPFKEFVHYYKPQTTYCIYISEGAYLKRLVFKKARTIFPQTPPVVTGAPSKVATSWKAPWI